MEQVINLEFTPKLRELLKSYCLTQYEESACIDDYHLEMEYHRLINENNLNALFELEHFQNRIKYEYEQSRENFG